MNEELRELEAELSTFEPAPVSLELRERIGDALSSGNDVVPAVGTARQRVRYMVWMAVAVSVLLAVGSIAYRQFGGDEHESPQPAPRQIARDSDVTHQEATSSPSLWAYRVAMADSPQRLDAMLDLHATTLLTPEADMMRAGSTGP
jgi:hypothetical protein